MVPTSWSNTSSGPCSGLLHTILVHYASVALAGRGGAGSLRSHCPGAVGRTGSSPCVHGMLRAWGRPDLTGTHSSVSIEGSFYPSFSHALSCRPLQRAWPPPRFTPETVPLLFPPLKSVFAQTPAWPSPSFWCPVTGHWSFLSFLNGSQEESGLELGSW